MKGLTAQQTLAAARIIIKRQLGFFSVAVYNLIPVESPGRGTVACTQRWVLLYDPEVIMQWGIKGTVGALIHELGHLLREHFKRSERQGVKPHEQRLANECQDAAINQDQPPQFPLPVNPILPHKLNPPQEKGLPWEVYFANCRRHQPPQSGKGKSGQGSPQSSQGQADASGQGNAQSPSPGDTSPQGASGQPQPQPSQGASQPGSQSQLGHGHCGSCAGHPVPGEPPDGKVGDLGRSDAEIHRIKKQVAKDIQRATKKQAGDVPGNWARWAKKQLDAPQVRWEDQLARSGRHAVAHKAGQLDYSYDRPSRRQGAIGYGPGVPVLPRMVAPIPETMLLTDTSGSMQKAEISLVMSEGAGIMRNLETRMRFGCFDAKMQGVVKEVRSIKEAVKYLQGGGGTNFGVVFEAIKKMKNRPDILVIGTDGCGPAPRLNPLPNTKTIWLLVGRDARRPTYGRGKPIQWGEFITVKEPLKKKRRAA